MLQAGVVFPSMFFNLVLTSIEYKERLNNKIESKPKWENQ